MIDTNGEYFNPNDNKHDVDEYARLALEFYAAFKESVHKATHIIEAHYRSGYTYPLSVNVNYANKHMARVRVNYRASKALLNDVKQNYNNRNALYDNCVQLLSDLDTVYVEIESLFNDFCSLVRESYAKDNEIINERIKVKQAELVLARKAVEDAHKAALDLQNELDKLEEGLKF